ncbi:MAG: hypothetical protein GXP45_02670 [bacterium]|nr:hypothetical protein [bacterium]
MARSFPYSRSFFHHIIKREGIHIAQKDKKIKKSYQLKNNDIIIIDDLQRYLSSEIMEEAPVLDIPIIKETDDYLVIHKPK